MGVTIEEWDMWLNGCDGRMERASAITWVPGVSVVA